MQRFLRLLSPAIFALPMLCASLAGEAGAETVLGDVSGNWAGQSGQGFAFRAILTDEAGQARLRIWQGAEGAALIGDPQIDVLGVVYRDSIIAGDHQGLDLEVGPDATTLRIVTETDDEEAEVREVLEVQFLDFQYTVTGYSLDIAFADGAAPYSCALDLRAGLRVIDGRQESLPSRPFEDDNLSAWGPTVALDKGLCPRPG